MEAPRARDPSSVGRPIWLSTRGLLFFFLYAGTFSSACSRG